MKIGIPPFKENTYWKLGLTLTTTPIEGGPTISMHEEFKVMCNYKKHVLQLLSKLQTKCIGLWMTKRKGGDDSQWFGIPMP